MGLTQTVLRSRALAALTSPHGVDRYLEQVNPMWAAREVRARDRRRAPRGRRPRPPAGRHAHAAADQHLARPPRRPARAARRRDRRRAAYDAGASPSPAPTPARRPVHDHAAGQPRRASSRASSSSARTPGTMVHLSQAEGDFVLPDRVPEHVAPHLRRLRHHAGDVDAAQPAAPRPPRPGHLRALRAEPRPPDLRRGARDRSAAPATASTCTCCTPSSATRRSRRRTSSGWCPATATSPPGPAARRR